MLKVPKMLITDKAVQLSRGIGKIISNVCLMTKKLSTVIG